MVPGARDVRGSLDAPEATDSCVVACPPHPQMGGSRSNPRLTAVGDALVERGVAYLRFDYGPWDEGTGELRDVANALDWARERYESVGLFGYSFGGCLALVAAADAPDLAAVSALAPAARIGDDLDAVAAIDAVACPGQVVYGERDDTVDWQPVVDRATERGFEVAAMAADHHFVGQSDDVAAAVSEFLAARV